MFYRVYQLDSAWLCLYKTRIAIWKDRALPKLFGDNCPNDFIELVYFYHLIQSTQL